MSVPWLGLCQYRTSHRGKGYVSTGHRLRGYAAYGAMWCCVRAWSYALPTRCPILVSSTEIHPRSLGSGV
eukprot:1308882-Rhodomonas_salina.1